jgi:hypothetical protein
VPPLHIQSVFYPFCMLTLHCVLAGSHYLQQEQPGLLAAVN